MFATWFDVWKKWRNIHVLHGLSFGVLYKCCMQTQQPIHRPEIETKLKRDGCWKRQQVNKVRKKAEYIEIFQSWTLSSILKVLNWFCTGWLLSSISKKYMDLFVCRNNFNVVSMVLFGWRDNFLTNNSSLIHQPEWNEKIAVIMRHSSCEKFIIEKYKYFHSFKI